VKFLEFLLVFAMCPILSSVAAQGPTAAATNNFVPPALRETIPCRACSGLNYDPILKSHNNVPAPSVSNWIRSAPHDDNLLRYLRESSGGLPNIKWWSGSMSMVIR
jgi:hypothetical protein